ncbi:hypothetical protein [Pseudomonas koreensis]|uniref:hypothetical protein n=1 Tax=Pseudomonas koreensis TaxID=198620 RepID=UPI001CA3D09E|nr:hypothetical protein [Pseudomonas koreensis]
MTHTPQTPPPSDRIGGGGAATSAGIRFEQQLGALFSAWILAGDRLDGSFRLGAATAEWIRFETEAPVDDLLIKTSNGGYLAVQAKTTASISEDLGSPFGKTISQFVRHWLVAQQGNASMEWNRPLDPTRDRLVLAVSPQASNQIKTDLPAALRLVSQPGGGALNQAQHRAYKVFSSLVEQAWASITKSTYDDDLLLKLAELIVVFTFDGDTGYALASGSLYKAFGQGIDAAAAFTTLTDLSGQLMKQRGGGDLLTWRQLLAGQGFALSAPPEYRSDIEALKRHSKGIASALASYEKIDMGNGDFLSVRRECQAEVETAVLNGPLLIIGEPGAGKSGVLNTLAKRLCDDGLDVLQLAVDRYSIESLEGLSRELGLAHPLLDVIDAWDGPSKAYLIIDALDATRGGRGENVFRALIERVLERKGRWNVVASIRNFDLRMGQQLRTLFKGTPPQPSLADSSFPNVSHIQVPPWSETEFQQLLQQSPALAMCLAQSPPRLRELAMVPFNTRLLSELISANAVKNLDVIASQADLLDLYWDNRVEGHGSPAKISLKRMVQLMVEARALRAPMIDVAADNPAMIDTLCQEGVIVVVDNRRWVQFRHHLLFDYAAAKLFLDPDAIGRGVYRFKKTDALGLMLSPALGFVLREIWESQADRRPFWVSLGTLINDEHGDPITRSTAGRLGAEFPISAEDCLQLGKLAISKDKLAQGTLSHVIGALAVQLEDEKNVTLEPWVHLADYLATSPESVANTLRFLLHNLIGRAQDDAFKPMVGRAARSLLTYGLTQPEPGFMVRTAIDFVIATYGSDVAASKELLAQLFTRDRLDRFGHEEVPAVCYKIEALGEIDPEFVSTIVYPVVFDYQVTEDQKTRISHSQILNLTSNARQDYEMARWSLGEYLPKFLKLHPEAAIRAVVNAVEGYVSREHAISDNALNVELEVDGRAIHLREDRSYIWAHNPDSPHDRDASRLVAKLRKYLKTAPEVEALTAIKLLSTEASLAIFWSRMFLCAVERFESLVDLLWPVAVTEPFLVLPDTRKDAIDLVAKGFVRQPMQERQSFEERVLQFDFSSYKYAEARQAFLERIFGAISRENLVTEEARRILDASPQDQVETNQRLFSVQTSWGSPEDFFWIEGLDRNTPENASAIGAIKSAEKLIELEANSAETSDVSLEGLLAALNSIQARLADDAVHAGLKRYAEGVIGQGCEAIVSRKLLASTPLPPTAEQDSTFTTLLEIAAGSESPEMDEDTEAQFEKSAAWGSPAARVEAAQAYWDLFAQRPDLYTKLAKKAEELLSDPHPAVRLSAVVRLIRIWDIDRERFWHLLKERLTNEPNLSVVEHLLDGLISRLIHSDQERTQELLLLLSQRETPGSDRQQRLQEAIADKLTILWITYDSTEAREVIDQWIREPWRHAEQANKILAILRDAIITGVGDTPDKYVGLRHRSQALVSEIVNAANTRLARYLTAPDPDGTDSEDVRECARLIDTAGMQMFFAADADSDRLMGEASSFRRGLDVFLQENADLLKRIGEYAQPHTTYYLLQLVERLVDVDAGAAFDLAASILQSSTRSGYQNDSLGVDLLVKLVGVFLADHKGIFEDSARRIALIDCLEIFMDAGWPAARRLLYRLPEFIQ